MITSPRRPTFSPPVTRHFEFTRLQDQLIARAYQVLIPVVSRPWIGRDPAATTRPWSKLSSPRSGELDEP